MKKYSVLNFLILPLLVQAGSAWQAIETDGRVQLLHQTESGVVAVDFHAEVIRTVNGREWETVLQLGNPGTGNYLQDVVRSDGGLGLVVGSSQASVTGASTTSLFSTTDGLVWETAIDGSAYGPDGLQMGEPLAIEGGWILASSRKPPAIIWHSPDGLHWNEVLRDDNFALEEAWRQNGGQFVVHSTGEGSSRSLSSDNGLDWVVLFPQPGLMMAIGDYYIGINTGPVLTGALYYSEDGVSWDLVLEKGSGMPSKRLIQANGILLFMDDYDRLLYSTDGLTWSEANLPAHPVFDISSPKKVEFGYSGGAFWYRQIASVPPGFPVPDPDRVTFTSVDGAEWLVAEWPEDYENEAVLPVVNPLYSPPPPPVGRPSRNNLPPAKEIHMTGYSLKMEAVPEGGRMGLYLRESEGDYAIVNSSFGREDLDYPYSEPEDIAKIGNIFLVLNEVGMIGLFDPAANYLAQPLAVRASRGEFDDHIEVSWNPVAGATHYRVYRSGKDDTPPGDAVAVVEDPVFVDTETLDPGTEYNYRIQSLSDDRESLPSLPATGRLWSLLYDQIGLGSGWGEIIIDPIYLPDGNTGRPAQPFSKASLIHYPWMWTPEHHWMYALEKPGHLWLWDIQLGWLWTRNTLYPFVFSMETRQWKYFIAAGDHVRWFYDYGEKQYQSLVR